ncbi:MAG: aggregation factor core, partial [Pseudomonadota bacterium]
MTPKITVLAACALISAPGAMADISVRFTESAPKDRFTIQNTGPCPVSQISLTLDLAQSAGNLIFDTAAGGSGVEVFQPFEFVGTADANLTIEDGAQSLTLAIAELGPDASIAF